MTDSRNIRNVALVGQGGAGKTSLAEALLFLAKATPRRGRVEEGSSLLDFDPDERERKHSLDTAMAELTHGGVRVTLLDTPGLVDFLAEAVGALRAADTALFVVPASSGVGVNTRTLWQYAEREGLARALVVNGCDGENLSLGQVLAEVRETFGNRLVPFTWPQGEGPAFEGVVPCLEAGEAADAEARRWHETLVEAVVEADEAAMERYLEEGRIEPDEAARLVTRAMAAGTLVPVFFTSAAKEVGLAELLDALVRYFPSPADMPPRRAARAAEGEPEVELPADGSGPFVAQVFKVVIDDYVGKIAWFRVFAGELPAQTPFFVPRTGSREKAASLLLAHGKETQPVTRVGPGDIRGAARVESLQVGDTLTAGDTLFLPPIPFPEPMVSLAVQPKARGDEARLGPALQKLAEEDAGLQVRRDPQTNETVITGMSDLHLRLKLGRMQRRYKVEVESRLPQVPYLETITAPAEAQYRHKKQTGGAGQFAEVHMRVKPLERGKGFAFVSTVVGGAISANFLPSIEKGVKQVMAQGVIAGYPVRDVYVEVYDGKEHPVDSKDIAFQIAGREVFKRCVEQARPVLLEPIMNVEVTVPTRYMGDITSDINSRRGRILGMEAEGNMQVIKAQIPLGEMQTYSTELRSLTGGEGSYRARLGHYDIVPPHIAEQIVARRRQAQEAQKA